MRRSAPGTEFTLASNHGSEMSGEVLTIREVASLLKLTEKTIYSMAQRGELPAFKMRGQWRIRRVALDEWLDEQTRRAKGTEEEIP